MRTFGRQQWLQYLQVLYVWGALGKTAVILYIVKPHTTTSKSCSDFIQRLNKVLYFLLLTGSIRFRTFHVSFIYLSHDVFQWSDNCDFIILKCQGFKASEEGKYHVRREIHCEKYFKCYGIAEYLSDVARVDVVDDVCGYGRPNEWLRCCGHLKVFLSRWYRVAEYGACFRELDSSGSGSGSGGNICIVITTFTFIFFFTFFFSTAWVNEIFLL